MKVSLRVLAALNERQSPVPSDVQALRDYVGEDGALDLDELACEVIHKALGARAKARAAIKTA